MLQKSGISISFKKVFATILGIGVSGMFATGCNDIPTEVGSDFVRDTSVVTKVASSATLPLIESTSVERIGLVRYNNIIKNIGYGNPTIVIGAAPGGQKAYTFLSPAAFADSVKSITEGQLESATLLLTPTRYALGDTASEEFSFKVYSLKKPLNILDTLETVFPPDGQTEYFDASTPISEFNGTVNRDSATPIEVNIPKGVVAQWFSTGDTSGLALAPGASTKYIQQFKGLNSNLSYAINMRVIYTKDGSLDTLQLSMPAYGSFVDAPGAESPDDIVVQSGTSYRTAIDFDLRSIEEFASIHSAKFTLFLKSELISSQRRRAVLVERVPNPAGNFNDILASYGTLVDSASGRYEFPGLGSRVEKWMRGTRKGRLYLIMENESETADRAVFFGANAADSTLRPRLEILYSTRPR